jgi:hypothetical protein
MSADAARKLSGKLGELAGVREAVVIHEEGLVMLKIDLQQSWDERAALRLIETAGRV